MSPVGDRADRAGAPGTVRRMQRSIVHDVHMAINQAHRFVYFVPEMAEECAAVGVTGRGSYFGPRAAPMGPVPAQVVLATFYNFSPLAVHAGMAGVWDAASPAALQGARFRAVRRALTRTGADLSPAAVDEARGIVDPVVAALDLAGKPLAAGNAAVALPDDPLLALWQQLTVLREWRGDAHIVVLAANQVGPCDCMVLQVGTGRFPLGITQATRQWDERQWAESVERLAARGWAEPSGALTALGTAERERIEDETDRLCEPVWAPVGDAGAVRLGELIAPITAAMDAAGTYAALA